MEINRHLNVATLPVSDSAATAKSNAGASAARTDAGAAVSRPLEQLQDALRSLPEVEMDKVLALRQALREGTLDSSGTALAAGILVYHGVKDA